MFVVNILFETITLQKGTHPAPHTLICVSECPPLTLGMFPRLFIHDLETRTLTTSSGLGFTSI